MEKNMLLGFGCPVRGYAVSLALVLVVSTWLPVAWRDPIWGWTLHKNQQLITYLTYIILSYIILSYIYIIIYITIYIYNYIYIYIYLTQNLIIFDMKRCKFTGWTMLKAPFSSNPHVPAVTLSRPSFRPSFRRRSLRALRGAGSPGSSDDRCDDGMILGTDYLEISWNILKYTIQWIILYYPLQYVYNDI